MGYSYDAITNALCCDECGKSGGVRKVKCPFGWCPPPALCAECKANPKLKVALTKEWHRKNGCEASMLRFQAENQYRAHLAETGHHVLKAGMSVKGTQMVHAIFSNGEEEIGALIPSHIYAKRAEVTSLEIFEEVSGQTFERAPAKYY